MKGFKLDNNYVILDDEDFEAADAEKTKLIEIINFVDQKEIENLYYELKKHWLAHTRKICLRYNLPIVKKQTGLKKRRSFICVNCQNIYN